MPKLSDLTPGELDALFEALSPDEQEAVTHIEMVRARNRAYWRRNKDKFNARRRARTARARAVVKEIENE